MIRECFIKFSFSINIFLLFSFTNPVGASLQLQSDKTHSTSTSNFENEIFVYINLHRKSVGLKPLELSNIESSAAAQHSHNMASGKIPFGHAGFQKRIKMIAGQEGNITASAENIAYGIMSAKEVVNVWLQSPEHKKNIEGDFTFTGIGVAKGKKGTIYYTEIFTRQE